jgi:AraC-like DNA-binding protein
MKKNTTAPAGSPAGDFWHYIPYSEEDKKLGMVCTTAGSTEIPPNTVYPPRKNLHPVPFRPVAEGRTLQEFQIVYITDGEGVFSAEGNTWQVRPGAMLLILPGMWHRYQPVFETGWHEYWAGFNGDYFTGLVREGILSREHVFFDMGFSEYALGQFNRVIDEVRSQLPLFQFNACVAILALLSEMLSHERRAGQPDYNQQIVEKAKCLMEANAYGAINLSYISDAIGISASRFSEVFRNYTSMTPYQYYIHIKIHKAETLLEQNNMPVKEVAYRMGFEDQYYFSRLFKSKTGYTPSQWKSLIRPKDNSAQASSVNLFPIPERHITG